MKLRIIGILSLVTFSLQAVAGVTSSGGVAGNVTPLACEFYKEATTPTDKYSGYRMTLHGDQAPGFFDVEAHGLINGNWVPLPLEFHILKPRQLFHRLKPIVPGDPKPVDSIVRFKYVWQLEDSSKFLRISFDSDKFDLQRGNYDASVTFKGLIENNDEERLEGKCFMDVQEEKNPYLVK